jgi:hypothetical protein
LSEDHKHLHAPLKTWPHLELPVGEHLSRLCKCGS